MDIPLACLRLYRASIPRRVRDVVGRLIGGKSAWATADGQWHFHDYSARRWDDEYRTEKWRYMHGLTELARYSVVVGYVQHLAARGEVLDLGCGEGILQQRLGQASYARYVGVDISGAAIEAASLRANPQTSFVCADVARYHPSGSFDVIVLNEVLYYISDPLGLLRHYEQFLKPNGMFVISMFATEQTNTNWRVLEREYRFLDQTSTRNAHSGYAWDCRVTTRH